MMVDFLTVEMPDPFGFNIIGGEVLKVGVDGVVEWSTMCKKTVKGSWDSSLVVRNVADCEYAELQDDNYDYVKYTVWEAWIVMARSGILTIESPVQDR